MNLDTSDRPADRVDAALAGFLDERAAVWVEADPRPVWRLVRALVMAPGQRLPAVLCYWGWRAAGGEDRLSIVQVAASFELRHAAGRIHDQLRATARTTPALHDLLADLHARSAWRGDARQFGITTAVACASLLTAWADELFHACGLPVAVRHRASEQLIDHCVQTSLGRIVDLGGRAHGGPAAPAGAGGPLLVGAVLAGADEKLQDQLRRFGTALGEALRLRDDTRDPDGLSSAVVAIARTRATPRQARQITALSGRTRMTPHGAGTLRDILLDTGAVTAAEDMIDQRVRACRDTIAEMPIDAVVRDAFGRLVDLASVGGER